MAYTPTLDHASGSYFSDSSIVAYYRFERDLKDFTKNYDNTNVTANLITYESGRYVSAGKFVDASTNGTTVASNLGIDGGDITISAWIKIASEPPTGHVYGIFGTTSANTKVAYALLYSGVKGAPINYWNHGLNFTRSKVGSQDQFCRYDVTLTTGTWYNVVATYLTEIEGTYYYNLNLYLNGNLVAGPVTAYGNGASGIDLSGIGCNGGYATENYYMNGDIDEVVVWNRALSSTEVLNYYKTRGRHRILNGFSVMQ